MQFLSDLKKSGGPPKTKRNQYLQKICIKYRKHGSSSFSFAIDCRCSAYFDPKKYILKPKFDFFFAFMLIINQYNGQKLSFCTCFSLEKMTKTPSKVGYFGKIAEVLSTAKSARSAQKVEKYFSMFPILGTNLWFHYYLVLEVMWGQPIKLIQVASNSELR